MSHSSLPDLPDLPDLPALTRRRAARLFAVTSDDTGAATAEYAIATMATVGDLEHN